jgi:hypothetical protein
LLPTGLAPFRSSIGAGFARPVSALAAQGEI